MANKPFDLAKLDVEKIRHQKKRKLLIWSLPICIVVAILSLVLLIMTIGTKLSISKYDKKNYQSSQKTLSNLRYINLFDRYKTKYNYGTALLGNSRYKEAEAEFKEALLDVPLSFECQVRFNMVISVVAQAEQFYADKKYNEAILAYDRAKAVIDGKDCGIGKEDTSDGTKEANEKLNKKREEISNKQDRAKQEMNNDDPGDGNQGEGDEPSDNKPPQDKLKELESQQDDNIKELSKRKRSSRDLQLYDKLEGQPYNKRNW